MIKITTTNPEYTLPHLNHLTPEPVGCEELEQCLFGAEQSMYYFRFTLWHDGEPIQALPVWVGRELNSQPDIIRWDWESG